MKINKILIVFLMILCILQISPFKEDVFAATGIKTSQRIEVKDSLTGTYKAYPTPTYNINNKLYFDLHNIAWILKETPIMFDYKEENNNIIIQKGYASSSIRIYSPWGENNEGLKYLTNQKEEATPIKVNFYVNEKNISLNGYDIYGQKLFRLEDLSGILNFKVTLNPKNKYYYIDYNKTDEIILIDGKIDEEILDSGHGRYVSVINSYIYDNKNNTFTIVNGNKEKVSIMIYDSNTFKKLSEKSVKNELPKLN